MEPQIEQKIDEMLEIVRFIKDNGATAESVDNLGKELRAEMRELRTELHGEIEELRTEMQDGFDSLRQEIREVRVELEAVKRDLQILEQRSREDSDAAGENYFDLEQRIKALEKKVKQLEVAH